MADSDERVRIWELADEQGVDDTGAVVEYLSSRGYDVETHASTLTGDVLAQARADLAKEYGEADGGDGTGDGSSDGEPEAGEGATSSAYVLEGKASIRVGRTTAQKGETISAKEYERLPERVQAFFTAQPGGGDEA
jgi:hypothetical protein